jgi:Protein of unknown function (DUF3551)
MQKLGLLASAAALAAVALSILPDQAAAQDYPYCAMRGGRGSSETCGFTSLAQCRVTVSGTGGYCQANPRFFAAYRVLDEYGAPRRRTRTY